MSNYQELKQQAAELLRQAEELRASERGQVLSQVREMIAEWNFNATELGLKSKADKRSRVAVKYQHPSGKTWSGRGRMPGWMAAEIANGATQEQFLVQ